MSACEKHNDSNCTVCPKDDNGDFILSAVVGYATNSGLIGGLVGGDLVGGMLGDALNSDDD